MGEMQAQALQEKKSDLEGTQKELDAALAYYEKLKPTCVTGGTSGESFEEIAELTKAIADLDAAIEKATGIRNAERKKNKETIKDAQDAQVAVAAALTVLKEFYAKASKATSLAREPEIFSDEPYKGMSGM